MGKPSVSHAIQKRASSYVRASVGGESGRRGVGIGTVAVFAVFRFVSSGEDVGGAATPKRKSSHALRRAGMRRSEV